MTDQFRLSRVQLVNWGTFDGYYDIPVGQKGFLITGGSGSGKSTLIDAFSAILVPPAKVRFNAASQQDISRDKGRNQVSYIRGAWRRSEDPATGEIVTQYLRQGATVSIIALTYTSADETFTLVAIFRLNAGQNRNDQVKRLYGIFPRDIDIDQFVPLLTNALDKRKLEQEYKTAGSGVSFTDQYSVFANRFRSRLGIGSEEAQMLLHRTQSAKSLSSMDQLFRDYMLEEPGTFDIAAEAVATHDDLRQAYERLEDVNRQIEMLAPLPSADKKLKEARASQAHAEALSSALPAVRRSLEAQHLRDVIDERQAEIAELDVTLDALTQRHQVQKDALVQAAAQRNQFSDGQISYLEKDIARNEQQRAIRKSKAEAIASSLGLKTLDTATFAELKGQALQELSDAPFQREELDNHYFEARRAVGVLEEAASELRTELEGLSRRRSNIDQRFELLRQQLCDDTGLTRRQLPYVGELIDVLPDHSEWEPVIQRLLSGFAVTLLVPEEHERAVSDWVNHRHLGMRLEYRTVPTGVQPPRRPKDPNALFHKVQVVEDSARPWLATMLTTAFHYSLVRNVAELNQQTSRAATIDGLVRNPQDGTGSSRYVKDDRRALGNTRDYRLGSSNDAKVEALRGELKAAAEKYEAARRRQAEVQRKREIFEKQLKDAERVAETDWAEIDTGAIEDELATQRRTLDVLRSSPEAKQLEDAYVEADKALQSTAKELTATNKFLAVANEKLAEARSRLQTVEASEPLADSVDSKVFNELEDMLRAKTRKLTNQNVADLAEEVQRGLETTARVAGRAITEANTTISRILTAYLSTWPTESADLRDDPEFVGEAINRLEMLRSDRLPEFRGRFLDLLNGQSVMHLSQISTRIQRARGDIETSLGPINASLRRSPYVEGDSGPRYLQIEVRDNRGTEVIEFQRDLRDATSGSLSAADETSAIERYHKLAKIMDRLGSSERSDDRWRRLVLDTRRHVKFVGNEINSDGEVFNTHVDSASLSGGQAQKLVFFCLAAALRYRLAGVDADVPKYATIVLDEAFDRADPTFTRTAMDVFASFGFHMILATPMKLIQTLSPYVDGTIVIHYAEDAAKSTARSTFELIDTHALS